MKVVYNKPLTAEQISVAKDISKHCGISLDTAKLLFYRNIDSVEKAEKYLNAGEKYFYNPLDLDGMREAIERIAVAKEREEKILIFGDYDADGVSASTVLYRSLKEYGITPFVVVPEREEGYGLNVSKVETFKREKDISLLITVDCGISDGDKIKEIMRLGIDVIVTDHHEPPHVLPECIKINPKIKGQKYQFDGLCGAGVAYKLGYALIGKKANEYLDIVALATVADSMPLTDENRSIVVEGLKLMNSDKRRPLFKYLLPDNDKKITAQSIAFGLAPRVNAGGRMGDAKSALQAFISVDEKVIYALGEKLNEYNSLRQTECDNIYKSARALINEQKLYLNSVIMVKSAEWKTGFIGIVASKLVEDYNRPVIVFAENDNFLKGSARSVGEINIYDAINSAGKFALGYGGHSQAAGVSVTGEQYDNFYKAVCDYVDSMGKMPTESEILVDLKVNSEVSSDFVKEIDLLEPFGVGNKKPLFSVDVSGSVNAEPLKVGSQHYAFNTVAMEMLDFNGEDDIEMLAYDIKKEIVFEANYSVFRDRESVKGFVKHIIPYYDDFSVLSLRIFENELEKLKAGGENIKNTKLVLHSDIQIKGGSGTAYLVADERNLNRYDLHGLDTYLFEKKDKSNSNCVIVSAKKLADGYAEVVYLDKPIKIFAHENSTVCSDICGYDKIKNLSVDRSDFEEIFRFVACLTEKKFNNATEFYKIVAKDRFDGEQFVFVMLVFLELGFFVVKDGQIKRDTKVKKPLEQSKIYTAVCDIKKTE